MSKRMSYLVDLSKVVLSEGDTPSSWIHAMTKGKYQHPVYGEIDFSTERLNRFAESVVKKVRDIDPDIDYDHKARIGDAAGWVKNAEVRADGLYLFVEWTGDAVQKIKSKAYKYFSPEFLDEWEHPKSKTVFQDVLSGGAITNRPFLKDLSPLNLSEMLNPGEDPEEERNEMDPKKFTELLGLAEGASEEDMLAKIKEFQEKATKPPITLSDADAELQKLSETNPAIKLLMEQQKQLREDNAKTTATLRLAEVRNNVTQLGEELRTKHIALPAATIEVLTRVLHESPDAQGKAVLDMVKALGETGFVELGEKGQARTGSGDADPIKAFSDLVAKARTEDTKLSYVEAVSKVAMENPDAYRNYATNSYGNQAGVN
jgi:phage I-like protein